MKYLITLMTLFSITTVFAKCDIQQVNHTFQLMAQRAQIMQHVAEYKFKTGGTVYDAEQEVHVLQQTSNIAKKQGMDVSSLLVFSQLQMDLSKYIENYWMSYWHSNPSDKPASLSLINLGQMRQQISSIDKRLFPSIKASIPQFASCRNQQLQRAMTQQFQGIKGVPSLPNYQKIMLQALKNVRLATPVSNSH